MGTGIKDPFLLMGSGIKDPFFLIGALEPTNANETR